MHILFQTEVTTKILRSLQHRTAQKRSAGKIILTLLPSADASIIFEVYIINAFLLYFYLINF